MKHTSLILLTLFLLAACKMDVEYCPAPHPHRGHLDPVFNWSSSYVAHPDSMNIVAQRVVNEVTYLFTTSTKASGNQGYIRQSPTFDEDTTYHIAAGSPNHVLHLRAGEYKLLAYNSESAGAKFVFDDSYFSTHDLMEAVISDSICDAPEKVGAQYKGWLDRNHYSDYLYNADDMHIFSAMSSVIIPLDVKGDPVYKCTFTPRPLTQLIKINFTMKPKESGIVVDDITCCMSGACRSIRLSTGEVHTDKTYKVLYKPTFDKGTNYTASYAVQGSIRVPGLMPNPSDEASSGPGILQVNVHIHYPDKKNVVHYRVLQARINLFNTLKTTPSLKFDEQGVAKQTKAEITLNIDNIMGLTYDKIESIPDVGIDQWIDETPIGIDF